MAKSGFHPQTVKPPNPRCLSSPSFILRLQTKSALTGRPIARCAATQPGAPAAPARTGLRARGARAHAAAQARRRRRRHGRSFPFRESPVHILCPCLGIYVTAAGPGPPEMAVAPGVGSPEPALPLLYKWGGRGLGGARLRFGEETSSRLRPAPTSKSTTAPDPFSGGERREPGAPAPGSARRRAPRQPAFPAVRARPSPAGEAPGPPHPPPRHAPP